MSFEWKYSLPWHSRSTASVRRQLPKDDMNGTSPALLAISCTLTRLLVTGYLSDYWETVAPSLRATTSLAMETKSVRRHRRYKKLLDTVQIGSAILDVVGDGASIIPGLKCATNLVNQVVHVALVSPQDRRRVSLYVLIPAWVDSQRKQGRLRRTRRRHLCLLG